MSRILVILFGISITVSVSIAVTLSNAYGKQASMQDSLEVLLITSEGSDKIPVLIKLMQLNQQVKPDLSFDYAARARDLLQTFPDAKQESILLSQTGWLHYYQKEPDVALNYSVRAEKMASSEDFPEGVARAKLLRGRISREQGDYTQAVAALDSALVLTELTDTPSLRAVIFNEAGTVYRRRGESGKALESHTQALDLILNGDDKQALSNTYNYLGIIHDIIGNYDQALRYHLLSLGVQEELDNRRGMAASMTNIGTVHQRIGEYDEAMAFYERSLPIWDELDLRNERASTMNNMGAVQELLGEYEMARTYYEEAYTIWNELGNLYSISIALDNLGSIYMYLGEYEQALDLKKETLRNQKTLGNTRGIANTLTNMSSLYLKMMQPDSALTMADMGLEYAIETKSWFLIRNAHEILAAIHEHIGDNANALHHYKLYKAANDTLFNSDSQTIIADLQEQYRTRQQQQQIELLQNERELQNMWVFMLTGGFVLVIMFSGLMYNRYKLKDRAHKTQEQLHLAEIEKARLHAISVESRTRLLDAENKRKSEELEAARDLQLSMLPAVLPDNQYATISANMITAAEVGGDYYDVDMSQDGTLTFCIGDATGHGTKAGILVTAMKSLFNLMSHEKDLIDIMHRCSAAIKKMHLPGLYMTMAFARLKNRKLELVGAGMPPALIYRAGRGIVETNELKGMPIGSVLNYPYIKKTITLDPNDVVVLMSDGFPELNSPEGKMIGYTHALKILAESGKHDPQTIIKHFHRAAFDWTGSRRPNDDMTFLVLKMK
jgi:serine phosphatase RsbU (regulator of sigma subunit)/Tfp pilus assembly protein PilF